MVQLLPRVFTHRYHRQRFQFMANVGAYWALLDS